MNNLPCPPVVPPVTVGRPSGARNAEPCAPHQAWPPDIPIRHFLGISVHAMTMREARDVCEQAIVGRHRMVVGVVNAAKVVNMRRMPQLDDALSQTDLVLADGMAVVWASRLLRQPLPERVAGIDLFEELLDLANERGYRVYFLGATQEMLERLLSRISSQYPNLQVAGSRNGYFDDQQGPEIAQGIRNARPHMLFLGITSPKKETFLANFSHVMEVPVCHGVGGSFDVLAGKVKRAPAIWQRLGCEWLYRVLQEPRRMWKRYLVTNTLFIHLVIRELLHFRRAATR